MAGPQVEVAAKTRACGTTATCLWHRATCMFFTALPIDTQPAACTVCSTWFAYDRCGFCNANERLKFESQEVDCGTVDCARALRFCVTCLLSHCNSSLTSMRDRRWRRRNARQSTQVLGRLQNKVSPKLGMSSALLEAWPCKICARSSRLQQLIQPNRLRCTADLQGRSARCALTSPRTLRRRRQRCARLARRVWHA